MSSFYNENLWIVVQRDVENLAELDEKFIRTKLSKDEELNQLLRFYIKYRNIVKRLTDCHNQIIEYFKREMIKQILECTIVRMLEYKRDIVNITCSNYMWPDNFMVEMKFGPDDIALTTPAYYTSDRKALLQQREKCIEDLIANANKHEQAEEDEGTVMPEPQRKISLQAEIYVKSLMKKKAIKEAEEKKRKTIHDAIILIQSFEKRRKARCIRIEKEIERNAKKPLSLKDVESSEKEKGAIIVQKIWRGYRARRLIGQKFNRVEESFEMSVPCSQSRDILEKDVANLERKQELQMLAAEKYKEIINEERDQILKKNSLRIMEDITDEIRNWYLNWYNKLGFFDNFPSSEAGGSILIANGQTLTPEEYLERQINKEKKDVKKETKTTKKKVSTERSLMSKALEKLLKLNNDYRLNWKNYEYEKDKHRRDLIKENVYYEFQLEIRKVVDDIMRLEVKRLNEAVAKDNKLNKEKVKKPKLKKAKKSRRQKKKRPKRDQLADYEVEDQFKRLVLANVIKKYPRTRLCNWIGDLSYQNYEAQQESRDHHPHLAEIGQLVMEYCVLPLGSKWTHQFAPLVRSVNISGLPNYGKKFLVHSICTETGATLFELTPEMLTGEFKTKIEIDQLMKTVSKLSKLLAPSVIFVDGGHKPWLKKVPSELKYVRPKRFASMLTKLVKGIKSGDQVLFLTTSCEPHKASKGFVKIHDKFIVIPLTDYNTLYMYYKKLLRKYHNVDRNLDVSCLARMSIGFPLKCIQETIEHVLSLERRMTLKFKPLEQREIFEHLLTYDKSYTKIFEQIRKFEGRTPLAQRKAKMIADAKKNEEERQKERKKKSETF